jgi:hypothetical protein
VTRPRLVIVGGFLGAGKTSLLLAAAARVRAAGCRVGVITNDQGGELVDTHLFEANGVDAEEVTGGCFCCRFSEFVRSAERLLAGEPEVIFAEPVGSCADLSATILQPIKKFYGNRFQLAPLTVLADPQRAEQLLSQNADPHFSYLFHKQLAEADLVWFSKADRHRRLPDLPGVGARALSAHTGQGVGSWLEEVFQDTASVGAHLLDIDYEVYAEAEAALGWANWQTHLNLRRPLTPAAVAGPLLEHLDRVLTRSQASIAHLKVFDRCTGGYIRASLCQNGEEPSIDGALDAPPSSHHELVLNLRAGASPELLEAVIEDAVKQLPGRIRVLHRQSFRPAAPKPEHRFAEVI